MNTIRHSIYFWLREPARGDHLERVIAGLRKLADIEAVQSISVGIPAAVEQRKVVDSTYAVAAFMTFASVADQAAYQIHPLHKQFIADCGELWCRVQVYDAEDVG